MGRTTPSLGMAATEMQYHWESKEDYQLQAGCKSFCKLSQSTALWRSECGAKPWLCRLLLVGYVAPLAIIIPVPQVNTFRIACRKLNGPRTLINGCPTWRRSELPVQAGGKQMSHCSGMPHSSSKTCNTMRRFA